MFRLTVVSAGVSRSDEVKVTRVSVFGAATPTLSLSGGNAVYSGIPHLLSVMTDDGAVRIEWKSVSGPGEVLFSPRCAAQTSATFREAGTSSSRIGSRHGR